LPACPKEAVVSIAALAGVIEELSRLVAGLDAGCLSPGDAALAVSVFVRGENLCAAGTALCAERAARGGEHRRAGHSDPSSWLAERSGGSRGAARDALETATSLSKLPGLDRAVRGGDLSPNRARVVAEAASLDGSSETGLLEVARHGSLAELRDAAEAVKATARSLQDEARRYEAIRKARHLRTFMGRDGGFKGQLSLTPDAGAKVLAVLQPASDFFFDEARREGRREHNEAYLADALVAVITGVWPAGECGGVAAGGAEPAGESAGGAEPAGESAGGGGDPATEWAGGSGRMTTESGSAGESDGSVGDATSEPAGERATPTVIATTERAPADANDPPDTTNSGPTKSPPDRAAQQRRRRLSGPPRATVICRVDLQALRRGTLEPGESCEIPGVGPVPLAVARELFGDCFLKFVISDGVDIRTVVHYGRVIPAHLKTALQFRDRCCVVPGCGRTFGLEYDHLVEFAKGGPTSLDNLARLCGPHHAMKTHKGYRLSGGPGHWVWQAPGAPAAAADEPAGVAAADAGGPVGATG
jgi:hypothetical protein